MAGIQRAWIVVAGLGLLLAHSCLWSDRALGQDKVPTGEEVFARGVKAQGDPEKVKRIQSLHLTQDVEVPNAGTANVESLECIDGRGYQNMTFSGRKFIAKYDGTSFLTGPMGQEQIAVGPQALFARLEFVPSLAQSYRLFFDKVTNLGKTSFEGVDCYDIECEREGQTTIDCYFSIESGLLVGYTIEIAAGLGTTAGLVQVFVEDYQPIEEVLIPHKKTYRYPGSNQVLQVKSCKANQPIDEKVFNP